jgi:hypothetical protein
MGAGDPPRDLAKRVPESFSCKLQIARGETSFMAVGTFLVAARACLERAL